MTLSLSIRNGPVLLLIDGPYVLDQPAWDMLQELVPNLAALSAVIQAAEKAGRADA